MLKPNRKEYLTNKKYQLKYTLVIVLAMLIVAVVIGATAYWDICSGLSIEQAEKLMQWDKYIFRVVFLIFGAFIAGVFLSHKVIGPLRRIEESLEKINNGNFDINIKLRSGDEFQKVADGVNELSEKLRSLSEKNSEVRNEFKE